MASGLSLAHLTLIELTPPRGGGRGGGRRVVLVGFTLRAGRARRASASDDRRHGDDPTPFNGKVGPAPVPGDLVLFPSYVMHAVPPNQGERRITLSFNAIPDGLESWGYAIKFSG